MTPTPRADAADPVADWLVIDVEGASLVGEDLVAHLMELIGCTLSDRRGGRPIVVGLQLVEPEEMAALNAQHLGHEGPTDVLSFPIDGDPIGASADGRPDQPPWMLGDIVICPQVASDNAPAHAGTYEDELALLVVHGLLHLLGMDHAAADEQVAMQTREREVLERFHGPMAGDPWSS
jgi:probable rRNA maturation factor